MLPTFSTTKVFLSYRREDSAASAGRIYDRLVAHFGQPNLFFDVDTVSPGSRFAALVDGAIVDSDAIIVVIGRRWLTVKTADGARRLDDPDDWVRAEIETAFKHNLDVIPVLVDGALVPNRSDIPASLEPLIALQAIHVTEAHFHKDVDLLIRLLEKDAHPFQRWLRFVNVAFTKPGASIPLRFILSFWCFSSWSWLLFGLGVSFLVFFGSFLISVVLALIHLIVNRSAWGPALAVAVGWIFFVFLPSQVSFLVVGAAITFLSIHKWNDSNASFIRKRQPQTDHGP